MLIRVSSSSTLPYYIHKLIKLTVQVKYIFSFPGAELSARLFFSCDFGLLYSTYLLLQARCYGNFMSLKHSALQAGAAPATAISVAENITFKNLPEKIRAHTP